MPEQNGGGFAALLQGDVLNAALGIIGGLFKQSPARLSQIAQREQDAVDNGFPDYKSWEKAGSPWKPYGTLVHHLRLGYPVTDAMYVAAGYSPPSAGGPQIKIAPLEGGGGNVNPGLLFDPAKTLVKEIVEPGGTQKAGEKWYQAKWVKWAGIGLLVLALGIIIYRFSGKKRISYGRR